MAWNEPGNSSDDNKPRDPWGQGGRKPEGPPDLDQLLKQLQKKIRNLFGGGSARNTNSPGKKDGDALNLMGIICLLLLSVWFLMGAYQLDEQEQAVVLRLGVFHEIVGSGFHWNPPLVDKIYKENVTKVRTHTTKGQMLTEDENIVEVDISVQYNIADLQKFKLSIREPELALQEAADSALRHVVGSSKMDEVLTTGRGKIAQDVELRLGHYLDAYNTGIHLITVNVEDTKAPSAVKESFDDVSKAREDEERFKNEAQTYANQVVPEARGNSQRILEEAQGYRDQTVSRAEGEAARFQKLLAEYKKAPAVTRERLYLDAMQQVMQNNTKVMVDLKGSNNMIYLPLDKLLQNNPVAEPAPSPASNNPGSSNPGTASKAPTQADMDQLKQQIEALKSTINTGNRRRELRP
jgi:membrane protease subunit HflK